MPAAAQISSNTVYHSARVSSTGKVSAPQSRQGFPVVVVVVHYRLQFHGHHHTEGRGGGCRAGWRIRATQAGQWRSSRNSGAWRHWHSIGITLTQHSQAGSAKQRSSEM